MIFVCILTPFFRHFKAQKLVNIFQKPAFFATFQIWKSYAI
ncbi:hypothetical protein HMPREF0372_00711 [Flavonifractor plautii ATCC 29863]|uniref:Uncharacterized protein n=1 Tax=Flavonifractor plautii ATCC 29863 TaxID=411475 RepID=G9YMI9_FLAPL|nr:hypothetical protein HMPREF0372_00711 [Flavonifractor plautii ATCC 29863]